MSKDYRYWRRVHQLRRDEALLRRDYADVWYLRALAGFIRWWRRTVLQDEHEVQS